MKYLLWFMERLWGHRLARQTQQQLIELATASTQTSRQESSLLLQTQATCPGPQVLLGHTEFGQPVRLPLDTIVRAHSIITGGSGSGKTMAVLLVIDAILAAIIEASLALANCAIGFGLLDPKTELFLKSLFLISRRLAELPLALAEELSERIVIIDLTAKNQLTSYNIAKQWQGSDLDFFATSRVETMGEVLAPGDGLSLRGGLIIKQVLKLLAECKVPFGYVERVLANQEFRNSLALRAKSEAVRDYFLTQFKKESKATIAAVMARLASALLSTESLRLALSGEEVPDFRRYLDEGRLLLINCAGANISRTTARIMQALFLSDIRQAVFARQTQQPYLMFIDEAQVALRTKQLRENMDELLRLSRSFATFFCLVTQNLTAGANDADLIEVIHTNIKVALAMRGTSRDASFLKPALPVTGRLQKPRVNPFVQAEFYSLAEERAVLLDGVSHLPDRVAWLWLKALTGEAMKIKTAPLHIPSGIAFTRAVEQLREGQNFGQRVPRIPYLEALARREMGWSSMHSAEQTSEKSDKVEQLKRRYRQMREGDK